MHSTQTKNSLAKRLTKLVGIFFSLVLVFTISTYAWAPGQAPQALPGSGNVDVTSSLWNSNSLGIYIDTVRVGIGTTVPDSRLVSVEEGSLSNDTSAFKNNSGLRIIDSTDNLSLNFDANQIESLNGQLYLNFGSTNNIILAAGGGKVGIGTIDPGANLHIESSDPNVARFYSPSTSYGEIFIGQSLTTNKATALGYNVNGGYTFLQTYGDPWGTFVIKNGGNIGIGTANPAAKLEIYSDNSNANLRLTSGKTGGQSWIINSRVTGGNESQLGIYDVSAGKYRMVVNENGNVGIGTVSPDANLHVEGGGYDSPQLILSSSSGAAIRLRDYGSGDHQDIWLKNDGTNFAVEGDDTHLVIEGVGGNVGIGTTNPEGKLTVDGGMLWLTGLTANTGNLDGVGFWGGDNGGGIYPRGTAGAGFFIIGNSQGQIYLASSGNVGIGTNSPSSGLKLDIEGKVGATEYCDQSGNNCKTTSEMGGGGFVFINPITVYSNPSSGTIGWTTYNASAVIPAGASAIILEAEGALAGPDGGDIDAHIRIRKNSGSSSYVLLRGRAASGGDAIALSTQGFFPIDTDITFQYTVEAPGFQQGCIIKLIGYVM